MQSNFQQNYTCITYHKTTNDLQFTANAFYNEVCQSAFPHRCYIFRTQYQFKSSLTLKIASSTGPVPNAKPYFKSYSHTFPLTLQHCNESAVFLPSISLLKHTQGIDLHKLERLCSPSLHTGQESGSSIYCDLSPSGSGRQNRTEQSHNKYSSIIPGTIATLIIN